MRVIPIAVLLTLLINATVAQAGDDEFSRSTLKGLPGVFVILEEFSGQAEGAGFDTRTFQTDAELRLRLAGIKVLTRAESLETKAGAVLYIAVDPLHTKPDARAAYCVGLHLTQRVRLVSSEFEMLAPTWSQRMVGYGNLSYVRDTAKDLVDTFINAWLSVNPK